MTCDLSVIFLVIFFSFQVQVSDSVLHSLSCFGAEIFLKYSLIMRVLFIFQACSHCASVRNLHIKTDVIRLYFCLETTPSVIIIKSREKQQQHTTQYISTQPYSKTFL